MTLRIGEIVLFRIHVLWRFVELYVPPKFININDTVLKLMYLCSLATKFGQPQRAMMILCTALGATSSYIHQYTSISAKYIHRTNPPRLS